MSNGIGYTPRYSATRRCVRSWRVKAKIGMSERMRDIHSGVEPDSVSATIASTSMWFAVNMTAWAMAWANWSTLPSKRSRPRSRANWYVSAPSITSAMASTARAGYLPTADSPDSITASLPSSTAFATSDTSARVGTGLWIIDSIICVAVIVTRSRLRASVQDALLQAGELRVAHLDAEVAARDHHRVARPDDLLEPRDRLAALDLGDDARVAAGGREQRPRLLDVRRLAHERHREVIDVELGREPHVLAILVGQRLRRQPAAAPVDALVVRHLAAGGDHALDARAAHRHDPQLDLPVAEDQLVAGLDVLRQVRVGDADAAVGAVVRVERRIERERLALLSTARPPAKRSMRIFGPCRSPSTATCLPTAAAARRTPSTRRRWSAASPCEKLTRTTSAPRRMTSSRTPGASVAGPRVATILVRRSMGRG